MLRTDYTRYLETFYVRNVQVLIHCSVIYFAIVYLNDMHFVKIVVDLVTIYDLSTNFTNTPRISAIVKQVQVCSSENCTTKV